MWWALALDTSPHYAAAFLPGMLITGVGVGFALPTLVGAAATALPPGRFATGSAVTTMARQTGAVLGVAVMVGLIGEPRYGGSGPHGVPPRLADRRGRRGARGGGGPGAAPPGCRGPRLTRTGRNGTTTDWRSTGDVPWTAVSNRAACERTTRPSGMRAGSLPTALRTWGGRTRRRGRSRC